MSEADKFLKFDGSPPERPFVYDDDADELAARVAASDPALADILAKRTKANQVETAFAEWLEANGGEDVRVNWSTYQAVAEDGKSVSLDGVFSVDALRELLRLIDEAWPNKPTV